MNVKVTGTTMVFANAIEGRNGSFVKYTTSIGKKNRDGTFDNASIEIRFRGGNIPRFTDPANPDRVKIDIDDGFLTFRDYQNRDGAKRHAFFIMVMDYHYPEQASAPANVEADDDWEELPF